MMILNKDRWPARRWYIPGVKSDAINKDDLSICWQESLPPPLDIMRALQIFLFSSFGSHFFHHMFKMAFQANRRGSCQWYNKLSVTPTSVWTESKRSPPQQWSIQYITISDHSRLVWNRKGRRCDRKLQKPQQGYPPVLGFHHHHHFVSFYHLRTKHPQPSLARVIFGEMGDSPGPIPCYIMCPVLL